VLGAGLGTRGTRLAAPRNIPAFEVGLAENLALKRQRLHAIHGTSPTNPVLVAVDFERDDLADRLAQSGFSLDRSTMFIWEGVTQYLTEPAVRSTLAVLEAASSGSSLIFTVRADFLDGTNGASPRNVETSP
jgi:methyltransferase (TIGR00027 family)